MQETNKVLEDPLKEKNVLPLFAQKLSINHFSPTQFSYPDASWLFRYLVLNQEQRRKYLLPNSAMKAGIAVGNVLQNCLADTIWKLNSARKLSPVKWTKLKKEESLQEELEKFKDYEPQDEKDRSKHIKFIEELPTVVFNGFKALEEIGVATPVICEEQISITNDRTGNFFSCSLPVVGRTDFIFGNTSVPGEEPGGQSSHRHLPSFPEKVIEIKTKWSKLGKVKKNGERSFIRTSPPATPSFNHLIQCACYAAYYDFKVPVYLVYLTENGYKVFTSNNAAGLTVEGLKNNFQIMMNVFRRREKILAANEDKSKEEIIKGAIELIDPMFDHPWCWLNMPDEILREAKEMWSMH